MEVKCSEAVKAAFQREAAKKVHEIINVIWAWTVTTGVKDLAKMIDAAIKLGGLDPQVAKAFTEDEVKELGGKLEMFRRLEMRAEAQELLLSAIADHNIVLEVPVFATKTE